MKLLPWQWPQQDHHLRQPEIAYWSESWGLRQDERRNKSKGILSESLRDMLSLLGTASMTMKDIKSYILQMSWIAPSLKLHSTSSSFQTLPSEAIFFCTSLNFRFFSYYLCLQTMTLPAFLMRPNWSLHSSHTFFILCGYNSTADLETWAKVAEEVGLQVDSVPAGQSPWGTGGLSLEGPKGIFNPKKLPSESHSNLFSSVMPISQQNCAQAKCNMSNLTVMSRVLGLKL